MDNLRVVVFALCVAFGLTACVTPIIIPTATDLDTKGLLIGKVKLHKAGSGELLYRYEQNSTSPNFSYSIYQGGVKISGKNYAYQLIDNYIRVLVPPGKYELEEISRVYYSGRTKYPVKRSFTIEAGKVTNLGLMLALFEEGELSDVFRALFIDNSNDMRGYLNKEYPDIAARLADTEFIMPEIVYLDAKQVEALRIHMIRKLPNDRLNKRFVYTSAGTIGLLLRNAKGQITNIKWFDLGTYNDVGGCLQTVSRFACIVPDSDSVKHLYVNDGYNLVKRNMPVVTKKRMWYYLVGKSDIVFVDHDFAIHTSYNNGKTWTLDTSLKRELPHGDFSSVSINYGKQGYYLFSSGPDRTLAYRAYDGKEYTRLVSPPGILNISSIYETDRGIFTGARHTGRHTSTIFFLPKNLDTWARYKIPSPACEKIKVLDHASAKIAAYCSNKIYLTENQGTTWRQVMRTEIEK